MKEVKEVLGAAPKALKRHGARLSKLRINRRKGEPAWDPTILIHTDEEIQKDVLAELKWDAQVQPNEIGVSVKDGRAYVYPDSRRIHILNHGPPSVVMHIVSWRLSPVANDIEVKLFSERTDARHCRGCDPCTAMGCARCRRTRFRSRFQKGWVKLSGEGVFGL